MILGRLSVLCLLVSSNLIAQSPAIGREALIQDARVLANTLEEAHPDPYTAFGGRIGFHRTFQEKLRAIPEQGMTAQAFWNLFAPFVAHLEDGHTRLRPLEGAVQGPGLPLTFKVVGEDLVMVQGALAGARLVSISGRSMTQLRARQREIRGCENASGELDALRWNLASAEGLAMLLPDWKPGSALDVRLEHIDGACATHLLEPGKPPEPTVQSVSRVKGMPDVSKTSLAWRFLDPEGQIAILSIQDCVHYRENAFFYLSLPNPRSRKYLEATFETRHGRRPKNDAELTSSLPWALETFRDLALAMKAKGTKTLVVDLRSNSGGNSLISQILVYVLKGPEGVQKIRQGYSISRFSQALINNRGDQFNAVSDEGITLGPGDYSFASERRMQAGDDSPDGWKKGLEMFPSLAEELKAPRCAGIYAPPRIMALSSAGTFSAGFDILLALHRIGATLVGTPSGQAPNCFIDALAFTLPKSGLSATVSYKAVYNFKDAARGRVLPCDRPLTYNRLKTLGFDPNAEVLMALEDVR